MNTLFSPTLLKDRTALVTGTNTGIGAAVARALRANGAAVIGWERRPRPAGHPADFEIVTGDLSDADASARTVEELLARRRIDILINNAGTISRAPAADVRLASWRTVLAVNLESVFVLTQSVGRAMLARGGGSIVTIASLLSFQGGINVASYASSKHAVVGLTMALSNEWAGSGVTVNAIAPGYVATNNTAQLREDPARTREITARIPAGRWAEPDDIAGPVVFLCSPAARYISGHTLVVDGGWLGR